MGRSFIFGPSLVHPWFVLGLLPEEDRDGTRDEILNILHLYRFLLLFRYFKGRFRLAERALVAATARKWRCESGSLRSRIVAAELRYILLKKTEKHAICSMRKTIFNKKCSVCNTLFIQKCCVYKTFFVILQRRFGFIH